jgi:predicted ester cyclase
MAPDENKALIRRYLQAADENETSDWSILDEYIAEDFVAHYAQVPGVSLDREGMKQAAETFRLATPGGRHEIKMQVAEGDLVVSYIVGRGVHTGELFGSPRRTRKSRPTESPSIGSVTGRSLSTGRSSMSRVSWSSWACSPGCLSEPRRTRLVRDRRSPSQILRHDLQPLQVALVEAVRLASTTCSLRKRKSSASAEPSYSTAGGAAPREPTGGRERFGGGGGDFGSVSASVWASRLSFLSPTTARARRRTEPSSSATPVCPAKSPTG